MNRRPLTEIEKKALDCFVIQRRQEKNKRQDIGFIAADADLARITADDRAITYQDVKESIQRIDNQLIQENKEGAEMPKHKSDEDIKRIDKAVTSFLNQGLSNVEIADKIEEQDLLPFKVDGREVRGAVRRIEKAQDIVKPTKKSKANMPDKKETHSPDEISSDQLRIVMDTFRQYCQLNKAGRQYLSDVIRAVESFKD